MIREISYLKTIRNPMTSNPAYMAIIDDNRRIWGQFHGHGCSFYFVSGNNITDLHLTAEAVEALRVIVEKLQNEMAFQNYAYTISTQGHAPKKKTLTNAKKAGCGKKMKKRPSIKKKK